MTYSTNQVAEAAQVSLRQLQHWDERGVARAWKQERHRRVYSNDELFRVLLVAAMRKRGLSLQRVRAMLKSPQVTDLMIRSTAVLLIRQKGMRICDRDTALEACELEYGPVVIITVSSLLAQMKPRHAQHMARHAR